MQGAGIPSLVCNILSYKMYPTVPCRKERRISKEIISLKKYCPEKIGAGLISCGEGKVKCGRRKWNGISLCWSNNTLLIHNWEFNMCVRVGFSMT